MATTARNRAPTHLWIVGVLSLAWNGFGAYDYLMTRLHNTAYLQSMMPGTDANAIYSYVESFPVWASIGWGLGVWGGVLGSLLLLARSRWAAPTLALSLLGSVLGLGYQIANPGGPAEMHEGAGGIMPYVIMAVALGLLLYARALTTKGVLR